MRKSRNYYLAPPSMNNKTRFSSSTSPLCWGEKRKVCSEYDPLKWRHHKRFLCRSIAVREGVQGLPEEPLFPGSGGEGGKYYKCYSIHTCTSICKDDSSSHVFITYIANIT